MEKKAQTFHFWIEAMIFVVLFVVIVGIMGADMNERYNKSHDTTIGLNITPTVESLNTYRQDVENSTTQGQASVTDYGVLKLLTTPAIIFKAFGLIINFASGKFIYSIVMAMQLGTYGTYIAIFFQTLYIITISFIILKLVLRVNI